MCSKHVEAWNKLIVKQKFCTSSWLITEVNALHMFQIFVTNYFADISQYSFSMQNLFKDISSLRTIHRQNFEFEST